MKYADLPKNIYSKISFKESCIEWTGYVSPKGYGQLKYKKKNWKIHRLIYELLKGSIETGLQIDHLCRNRKCVNIAHLEPVTQQENMRRGFGASAIHARKTECIKGHKFSRVYTYKGTNRRLCDKCIKIKNDRANGKIGRKE